MIFIIVAFVYKVPFIFQMKLDESSVRSTRLAAKRVRHYFPTYTLEWDRKASFYKYPEHLEQQHDDLRKAGIS